ncbi:MAG: DUF2254 domain-containing protein [Verrucomicrobiales bacterium]|nr:DUF2254 domain-containing protein [Verrucomicrobiae bacterium]
MNRLKQLWNNLRSSFWFLPSCIVLGSIVIALALIHLDAVGDQQWMSRWPRLFGASAAGARGVLSTIAGSMMTVVGVTFSMVLVTLALASSQYTSRILRNFMRDRVTQVVLGVFAGIFSYCLILLRTIRGGDAAGFIPSVAVTFGVVLAIGGIGVLIFFIHHIAASIQASSIIASVAGETLDAVDRLFPGKLEENAGGEGEERPHDPMPTRNWRAVPAPRSGYIQSLDDVTLLRVAKEQNTLVRMERGVGEFVVRDTPLVWLDQREAPGDDIIADLQNAYGIDRHRTVDQDAGFGIRQLVDMALRALSPGINDTTTAVMCVDYLTAILSRLVTKGIPSSHRYEDGELRVIGIGPDFASLVAGSFDEIRGSASGNVAIMLRMLDALQTIGSLTHDAGRRRVLSEQLVCIGEAGSQAIPYTHDRARFDQRLSQVRVSLGSPPCTGAES